MSLSLSLDDFPVGNLEIGSYTGHEWPPEILSAWRRVWEFYFAGNHHELPRLYNEDPAQDNADQRQWQAIFSSIIKQIAINACACDRVTSLLGRTHISSEWNFGIPTGSHPLKSPIEPYHALNKLCLRSASSFHARTAVTIIMLNHPKWNHLWALADHLREKLRS